MKTDCASKVTDRKNHRIKDLRKLWDLHTEHPEAYDDELGNMYEYGLSFDYVPAGTFEDQHNGYFRYQLSYGGPSDEFRFYTDPEFNVQTVEYWFLDWFDGAKRELRGSEFQLMDEIFEMFFVHSGTARHKYEQATEY